MKRQKAAPTVPDPDTVRQRLAETGQRYEQALDALIAQRRSPSEEVLAALVAAEEALQRSQLNAKHLKTRVRQRVAAGYLADHGLPV
ncbi:MAG TPA: hypothetical protein VNT30_00300 [Stellaceae bacterium]|nr:hypothetical protein [Stellaceae bacterium]